MKRPSWIALVLAVVLTTALLGFPAGSSADIPKLPIKTLTFATPTPAPTLNAPILPHKTLHALPTATPKPTLNLPVLPHKTLIVDLPFATIEPVYTAVATYIPGLDPYARLDAGEVVDLGASTSLDLDGSGPMSIALSWSTDAYGYGTYTLTAGSASVTDDCISLAYELRFAKLAGMPGAIYLIVPDLGESDDPVSYVYTYQGGALHHVGDVPALPDTFDIHDGMFTTTIRGLLLQTWFRPADFDATPTIHEVRRSLYPMGTEVTLLKELPLRASRTDATIAATLHVGDHAILATTDDIEWVNVIKKGASSVGGWMHVTDVIQCDVGGLDVPAYELFDGLFMAD